MREVGCRAVAPSITVRCVLSTACVLGTVATEVPAVAAAGGIQFVDVTQQAGIDFVHSFGDRTFSNLIEAVGSGAVWLDYDGDGFVDLYVATGKFDPALSRGERADGTFRNRLYRNRGDGRFEDVTGQAGVGCEERFSMGVAAGDYDNDGDPDLYVCNFGPNALYRNNGDGTFTDLGRQAGVGHPGCSVAAAWLDYDRDGLIDLYVANYVEFEPKYDLFYAPDGFPGPLSYAGQKDALYRNRGDGTFEDVSEKVGIVKPGRAMSVAAGDYDGDGYDDLYVTNDAMENYLYHNEAGVRFADVGLISGVAFNGAGESVSSMGADFGDYDGDGRLDLFLSDSSLSSVFHNAGGGLFDDRAPQSGIARASAQFVGWGCFFFDYDNDGDLDLFKANADLSRPFGQEDQIFENLDGVRFRDVSDELGEYFRQEWRGRGACCADYDNDGDVDVFVVNLDSRPALLRNEGGNKGQWLSLRLVGRGSNRDGLGARVKVTAGGRTQLAEKRSCSGYLSQNDPRLLFGLGGSEAAERIEIVWPSGKVQVLENVAGRQILSVEEPRR